MSLCLRRLIRLPLIWQPHTCKRRETNAGSAAATLALYIPHHQVVHLSSADGIAVRDAGPGRGRGIFATRSFQRGDTVFKEKPLVSFL